MELYDHMLGKLDEMTFLGFKVWDFSFRSLFHRYGTAFLQEIVFRHPLRTLAGITRYRRWLQNYRPKNDITWFSRKSEQNFQRDSAQTEKSFLVAVSFCQKVMRESGSQNGCPAGRFNHRCLFLAQLDLSSPLKIPSVCQNCNIQSIGPKALSAGANVHIMTSALDILHDIFMPALKRARFSAAIFCVCPYSVHPIILPLFICGVEGFVVQFNEGYCKDYRQWSLADHGIKREHTFMQEEAYSKILNFLSGAAEIRGKLGKKAYHRFRLERNIYVPE